MTRRTCILLLCGLPGAGKTTFAKKLISEIGSVERKLSLPQAPVNDNVNKTINAVETVTAQAGYLPCPSFLLNNLAEQRHLSDAGTLAFNVKHVCYDTLILGDVYQDLKKHGERKHAETDLWKSHRQSIVRCVRDDIAELLCIKVDIDDCHIDPIYQQVSNIYTTLQWIFKGDESANDVMNIFVIDDNMFYPSMRQEYHQIAQQYNTGFCEVHIRCSVEEALERNRLRSDSVPDETIKHMALKFQPPSDRNNWEKHSLTLDLDTCCNLPNLSSVMRLLELAAENPAEKAPEVDVAAIAADRIVCSENMLHQIDQILRKLIGQQMGQFKGVNKKTYAADLNSAKKLLIQDFRCGAVSVSPELVPFVTDAAKFQDNPFHLFVIQSFEKRFKCS